MVLLCEYKRGKVKGEVMNFKLKFIAIHKAALLHVWSDRQMNYFRGHNFSTGGDRDKDILFVLDLLTLNIDLSY